MRQYLGAGVVDIDHVDVVVDAVPDVHVYVDGAVDKDWLEQRNIGENHLQYGAESLNGQDGRAVIAEGEDPTHAECLEVDDPSWSKIAKERAVKLFYCGMLELVF